jgi:hypothetical protein
VRHRNDATGRQRRGVLGRSARSRAGRPGQGRSGPVARLAWLARLVPAVGRAVSGSCGQGCLG